jgi:hypothetical protein
MPWYPQVHAAIKSALAFLVASQVTNLALLVSALLGQRTLCLSQLARAYPTPIKRRVPHPKHDLLHRLKRLWRFVDNGRIDPLTVQRALIPYTLAQLGRVRWLGLAIDWTMFDTILPHGQRRRYQVLRIAVPVAGRALPLLQLAYDRDHLPPDRSQNQLEEAALQAVLETLPAGVRPVVLADRGFARATFFAFLQQRGADYVVRIDRSTVLTAADGTRTKLGHDGLRPGQLRWLAPVRYGLYHGRPRALWLNVALCWRVGKRRTSQRTAPKEPWYLATSLPDAGRTVAWYWRRGWIEQSFRDAKQRFGLSRVQVGCPDRLSRLVMALTLALSWLTVLGLPRRGLLPPQWDAHVSQRGRVSVLTRALTYLDEYRSLPSECLPGLS